MHSVIVFEFTLSTVHVYAGAYITAVNELNRHEGNEALQIVTSQILMLYYLLSLPTYVALVGSVGIISFTTLAGKANLPVWTAFVNPLILALPISLAEKQIWYGLRSPTLRAVPFSLLTIAVFRPPSDVSGEEEQTPLVQ